MRSQELLKDASAAVVFGYEKSMAFPAFSADGLEQSVIHVEPPRVRSVYAPSDDEGGGNRVIEVERAMFAPIVRETSVPIEIWEGVVNEVYEDSIAVTLTAKMNTAIPPHTMEIDLVEIQPQDRDLVVPGGVFYLTMYRETTARTVKNVQDIRFRRKPNWTRGMVEKMKRLAQELEF